MRRDELVGHKLGSYEIRGVLGCGGMGVVYDAYEAALDRRVALKVIRDHLAEEKDFVARFQREAKLAAKISHPAIAPVYATGYDQDRHFLAMEFVEGRNLADILTSRGRFPLGEALRTIRAIAEALVEIHEAGLVHRDIKPANTMIDTKGRVRLMDFGLARPVATDSDISQAGQLLGTPRYMAPEQFRCEPATAQTDIYALGLMLYEMLTGVHPFQTVKPAELSDVITKRGTPSITRDLPDVPVDVARLIAGMTALSPKDRCRNAQKIVTDLNALLREAPQRAANEECATTLLAETPSSVLRKSRRARLVNAAVALVLLLALALPHGLRDIMYLGAKQHERNDQLVLVDLGQWPADTSLIAETINKLTTNGAAAIGLDIILDEGSTLILPESLALPIGLAGNVVVATDLSTGHTKGLLPGVFDAAAGAGFVNVVTDLDGSVRRTRLTHAEREQGIRLSLASVLHRQYLRSVAKNSESAELSSSHAGEDSDVGGEFLIDFGGIRANTPIPVMPAFGKAPGAWSKALCQNKLFVLGTTEAEEDTHHTPLWGRSRRISGLALQGCILDNLLNGRHIRRLPGWTNIVFIVVALAVGFASGVRVPVPWLAAVWVAATIILAVASIVAMRYFSLALPMVCPVLGVVGSGVIGVWGGKRWPKFSSRF